MSRVCGCNWTECYNFSKEISSHAPDDDCWSGGFVQIRYYADTWDAMSLKNRAHHNSLKRCVNIDDFMKCTYLHRFHFP